jgi:iron-sulfur cluster repair protein YtfE (RIC family)
VSRLATAIRNDHREIEELFALFDKGAVDRGEIAGRLRRALSVHAAAEEQVLYPALRTVAGGDTLAERSLGEHQQVKEALAELDAMAVDDPRFAPTLATLRSQVAAHVAEEEQAALPLLDRHVGEERLEQLSHRFATAKKMAPTHPHPRAPNTPPANMVAGAAAAILDRARDAVGRLRR